MFSRWRPRLGTRMVLAFVFVVIVSMSLPALFTFNYLFSRISHESRSKMDSDLEIASLLFDEKTKSLLRAGRTLANDMMVEQFVAYRLGNPLLVRVSDFLRVLSEADLSALTVVDRDGAALLRSRIPQNTGDALKDDAFVARALKGEEVKGYAELTGAEMRMEGLAIEKRPTVTGENGFIMKVAVPIFRHKGPILEPAYKPAPKRARQEIVGVVVVMYLLNRDRALLEEVTRRTRGVATLYLYEAPVNTTRRGWATMAQPDLLEDIGRAKGRVVREYRGAGEMGGYFALRDIEGRILGMFELRSSTAATGRVWVVALWNNLFILLVGVLISAIMGFLMTKRITRPIEELRRGAEEIGHGNLLHRIVVTGSDETAELAESFNVMSMRLYQSMEQMRLSKKQVEDYSGRLRSAHDSLEMYSRELEKVNQQLLESNVKLQKANEVKDTFLSTVSHELKTPLTTIMGYLSMMLQGALGGVNEEQRLALEVMLRRARNLQSLIADLLSLSRLDAGRLELHRRYVDLGRELRTIEEIYAETLRDEKLSLLIRLEDRLPRVYADPDRVNQVMSNLVGNAIKFTAAGGRITVEALHPDGAGFVEIVVRDTGIGIPQSELPHIFERFYQVDRRESREFGGTGLGLAIAKELVDLHGGAIWVQSAEGMGSSFHFTLPTS